MFNIHLLPAGYGDSLLIEYGNRKTESYLLIDGGIHYAYEDVMAAIKEVAPNLKTIDLFVVTHIDTDHIDGAIMMLNDDSFPYKIKEIWFNGWDQISQSDLLGERQGEYLSALIKIKDVPHNTSFLNGVASLKKDNKPFEVEIAGGMKLLLLSPTPKHLEGK